MDYIDQKKNNKQTTQTINIQKTKIMKVNEKCFNHTTQIEQQVSC